MSAEYHINDDQKNTWYRHWILQGLTALEALLSSSPHTGQFCYHNQVTLADICLIPQLYNAKRYHCPLEQFPLIQKIDNNYLTHDAFIKALPENQIDAQ